MQSLSFSPLRGLPWRTRFRLLFGCRAARIFSVLFGASSRRVSAVYCYNFYQSNCIRSLYYFSVHNIGSRLSAAKILFSKTGKYTS